MYGKTTQYTVPSKFLTNYAAWDVYMGNVWAAMLNGFAYDPRMTIIEIAPGTSTKIGKALQQLHFQGTLYLVEPIQSSLQTILRQYKKWLPNTEIIPINKRLLDSVNDISKPIDFLLANHPFDDMIMAFPIKTDQQRTLFDWTTKPSKHVSASFKAHWCVLAAQTAMLDTIKQHIINEWKFAINSFQPATTIISQYASDALQKHDLQALNDQASDLLSSLQQQFMPASLLSYIQRILNQFENYNSHYIGMQVLNAQHWLIAQHHIGNTRAC